MLIIQYCVDGIALNIFKYLVFENNHAYKHFMQCKHFHTNLGPYFCTTSGCPWANFTKNVDWGYYDESNGDCESCRIKCDDDNKCKAFECGSTYCSWWAKGTCDDMRKENIYVTKNATCTNCSKWETCRITGILIQLCFL